MLMNKKEKLLRFCVRCGNTGKLWKQADGNHVYSVLCPYCQGAYVSNKWRR